MAILVTVDAAHARVMESFRVERDWYGLGSERWRYIYEARLVWPCDQDGAQGNTLPATYTNTNSVKLDLDTGNPDMGYDSRNGTFSAYYRGEGAWNYPA